MFIFSLILLPPLKLRPLDPGFSQSKTPDPYLYSLRYFFHFRPLPTLNALHRSAKGGAKIRIFEKLQYASNLPYIVYENRKYVIKLIKERRGIDSNTAGKKCTRGKEAGEGCT